MPIDRYALLTPSQMMEADRIAVSSAVSSSELMERAGQAVADAARRMVPAPAAIRILCGPGNNGGDGFVAARILAGRGYRVAVSLLAAPERLRGDAAEAALRWAGAVEPDFPPASPTPDLIVDALFGAGLTRPLDGAAAGWTEAANRAGCPILAVDIPSGLSGETGRADGPAIRAARTVTFFRLKPGHVLLPGRELCGAVELVQIGIPPEPVFSRLAPAGFVNHPELWLDAWPRHGLASHKFSRGALCVLAGGLEGVGAPRLAAHAALRIGAGLVTILCRPEALAAHAARGPDALMQRPLADPEELCRFLARRKVAAALAGPALGTDEAAGATLDRLIGQPLPLLLDADALTLIAGRQERMAALPTRAAATVLTPHEGEFRRLFGGLPDIPADASKLEKARRAAALTGCVVVYKGADTVVSEPGGRAAINTTGGPALATAGSGDVLGGAIAGLVAQGMPPFEAACAAVFLHGEAGQAAGRGLIADDLPVAIAARAACLEA